MTKGLSIGGHLDKFDTGNFAGAIQEYTKALAIYPDFARAYAGRSLALPSLGRDTEAEQDVKRAIEFDSSLKDQIERQVEEIKQKRSKLQGSRIR